MYGTKNFLQSCMCVSVMLGELVTNVLFIYFIFTKMTRFIGVLLQPNWDLFHTLLVCYMICVQNITMQVFTDSRKMLQNNIVFLKNVSYTKNLYAKCFFYND